MKLKRKRDGLNIRVKFRATIFLDRLNDFWRFEVGSDELVPRDMFRPAGGVVYEKKRERLSRRALYQATFAARLIRSADLRLD